MREKIENKKASTKLYKAGKFMMTGVTGAAAVVNAIGVVAPLIANAETNEGTQHQQNNWRANTIAQITAAASNQKLSTINAASANGYLVQWGDTLSGLAVVFNTTVDELAQMYGIDNPDLIFAGYTLGQQRQLNRGADMVFAGSTAIVQSTAAVRTPDFTISTVVGPTSGAEAYLPSGFYDSVNSSIAASKSNSALVNSSSAGADTSTTDLTAASEAASLAKSEADSLASSEAASVAKSEADSLASSEAASVAKSEADSLASSEAASVAKSEADSLASSEAASVAKSEADSLASSEAASVAQSEADSLASSEAASVAKSEADSLAASEADSVAKSEADSLASSEAASVAQSEADSLASSEAASVAKSEADSLAASEAASLASSAAVTSSLDAAKSAIPSSVVDSIRKSVASSVASSLAFSLSSQSDSLIFSASFWSRENQTSSLVSAKYPSIVSSVNSYYATSSELTWLRDVYGGGGNADKLSSMVSSSIVYEISANTRYLIYTNSSSIAKQAILDTSLAKASITSSYAAIDTSSIKASATSYLTDSLLTVLASTGSLPASSAVPDNYQGAIPLTLQSLTSLNLSKYPLSGGSDELSSVISAATTLYREGVTSFGNLSLITVSGKGYTSAQIASIGAFNADNVTFPMTLLAHLVDYGPSTVGELIRQMDLSQFQLYTSNLPLDVMLRANFDVDELLRDADVSRWNNLEQSFEFYPYDETDKPVTFTVPEGFMGQQFMVDLTKYALAPIDWEHSNYYVESNGKISAQQAQITFENAKRLVIDDNMEILGMRNILNQLAESLGIATDDPAYVSATAFFQQPYLVPLESYHVQAMEERNDMVAGYWPAMDVANHAFDNYNKAVNALKAAYATAHGIAPATLSNFTVQTVDTQNSRGTYHVLFTEESYKDDPDIKEWVANNGLKLPAITYITLEGGIIAL